MKFLALLSLVSLLGPCQGYRYFQDWIPNGNATVHPCKDDLAWQGVGHRNPGGGGPRNPFGLDFYKNGKMWDPCLCNYDSDGDGRTNGEELGDPYCEWTVGKVPKMTTGLSHPGICEPIDSPQCIVRNKDLGDFCDKGDTVNPCITQLKAQEGVKTMTLAFPDTAVPAKETSYMCQVYSLPEDGDYHLIAADPRIVNKDVNHHIIVYGCKDSAEVTDAPEECGMAESLCPDTLFVWAVGYGGTCLNQAFGFAMGASGYKKVLMQVHWNNPEERGDYRDSSGMELFYTPNLRPNEGAVLMTGQGFLAIPPGKEDHKETGVCPSNCTQDLSHSVYITEAMIHMHYLGSKGYIEHYRNGKKIGDIVVQDVYSYDTPVSFVFDEPIEFRPGDEIKTICHFDSTSRDKTTHWGEATNDEMCYGFLTYYPKVPMAACIAFGKFPTCAGLGPGNLGCNYTEFGVVSEPYWVPLFTDCDITGKTCFPACRALLDKWATETACLDDDVYRFTKYILGIYGGESGPAIATLLSSCEPKDNTTPKEDKNEKDSGRLCPAQIDPPTERTSAASTLLPPVVSLGMILMGLAAAHS